MCGKQSMSDHLIIAWEGWRSNPEGHLANHPTR
jgi:hypothetical protein